MRRDLGGDVGCGDGADAEVADDDSTTRCWSEDPMSESPSDQPLGVCKKTNLWGKDLCS